MRRDRLFKRAVGMYFFRWHMGQRYPLLQYADFILLPNGAWVGRQPLHVCTTADPRKIHRKRLPCLHVDLRRTLVKIEICFIKMSPVYIDGAHLYALKRSR